MLGGVVLYQKKVNKWGVLGGILLAIVIVLLLGLRTIVNCPVVLHIFNRIFLYFKERHNIFGNIICNKIQNRSCSRLTMSHPSIRSSSFEISRRSN